MTREEIKSLDIDGIENRLGEIRSMVDTAENIDELNEEVDALNERKKELKNDAETRKALRQKVMTGAGEEIKKPKETRNMNFENMTREEVMASKEYRSAVLKSALGRELTDVEKRATAHVYTTETHAIPLHTTLVNEIWDLIAEQHAILGDVTTYRTGTILELIKVTSVVKGKGKKVAELEANDDYNTTEVKVTLTGNDYSATVELSYAEASMSIDAFEQYLKDRIVAEVSDAMARDVITQIKASMNAGNKVTAAEAQLAYTDITNTFAKLKRCKSKVVYVNNTTLYAQLCGMVDKNGRPIFQPNAQAGAEGIILGAQVKLDDTLADGELLVGDPKRVVGNVITDVMLEYDKDIKVHKHIHSAYARAQYELMDDLSFALLTPKAAA